MLSAEYVPNTYFEVSFGVPTVGMSGYFTSVSGLSMEFEYETYSEGGCPYPRYFFKNVVPQTLVLEQGTVTSTDAFAAWVHMLNQGMHISLKDHTGALRRTWMVNDAMVVKYVGPSLDAMQPMLAVSRIELQHNGCI